MPVRGSRKRICKNGHDTLICGRNKSNNCRSCHILFLERHRLIHREDRKAYLKEWHKDDTPLQKLALALRIRINQSLKVKSWKKISHFKEYIGCSLPELKVHIENQFQLGMTWANKGQWHVDHIIPLASAKTSEELYKLCHYTNLQPLWAKANLSKGATYLH